MNDLPQPRPRPEIPEVEIERAALSVACPSCQAGAGLPCVGSYLGSHGPVRAHYARMRAGNAIPPLPEMVEDGEWRYPANRRIEAELAKFLLAEYDREMRDTPDDQTHTLAQIKARRTIVSWYLQSESRRGAEWYTERSEGSRRALGRVVELLSLPYRGDPDFKQRWPGV